MPLQIETAFFVEEFLKLFLKVFTFVRDNECSNCHQIGRDLRPLK